MITQDVLDRFLARARGQPLVEGTRYAREARVVPFTGTGSSVSTLVRGQSADFDVALWSEGDGLHGRCTCPSWRDPCKHVVAAALVLRQDLSGAAAPPPATGEAAPASDPALARQTALDERRTAARRERLLVRREEPPRLRVQSPSGFAYDVTVRGAADGPHGCTCPDFESNRLHTCKHVERVRAFLAGKRRSLGTAFCQLADRTRIYLHFGEVVEARLFGDPSGRGAPGVRAAFDGDGLPRRGLLGDPAALSAWLAGFPGWVEEDALTWLARRAARVPRLPAGAARSLLPRTAIELYDYQVEGALFLARAGRALLADEMGLGKTVQAILAAAALRRAQTPARRVTIVCPASLRAGWQDEIRRWLGEGAVLLGGSRVRRAQTIATGAPWLVTHYEQVLRDHADHARHAPDLLIVDEAQRVKGLLARTARALKAIETPYLFALTGTPLENRLEEAYAIAQLIDQRLLPPLWQIDRDHFVREPKRRSVVLYRHLGLLRSRLAPAFLRRRKEDVDLELPVRIRSVSRVRMHPLAREVHDEKMALVARILSRKVILPADMDRVQKLLVIARRAADGPHLVGHPTPDAAIPKLRELEQTLRDLCLGEGRKVVVFSEWVGMTSRAERLCRRLGLPSFHLHGGVPVQRRPALIRSLAQQEGPAVFVSTDAGGVGLNLQAADAVVCLDLPWNPARLEQRIARVHRIGSKRPVRIVLVVAEDCVEERILHLHDTKRDVFDNVWARDGVDQVAAPGGSGALRRMVEALLEREAPTPARRETNGAPAGGAAATAAEPAPSPPVAGATGAQGPPEVQRTLGAPVGLDSAAFGAAVAAVATTLPADQRRSLATVFRALAEALDVDPQPHPVGRPGVEARTAQRAAPR